MDARRTAGGPLIRARQPLPCGGHDGGTEKMLTRRDALGAALGTAAAVMLAPGARAQTAGRNVLIGGFDVGPGGLQGNFNPLAATAGFQWLNLYFETLVLYDAKLETIAGALAVNFESNPDKTQYTFHLDPKAAWHDGTPFVADDVVFTIDLAKDTKSGSVFPARLADIARVSTPDAHTAVLELSKPNASLPDILTKLMILPKHALSGLPRDGIDRDPWWAHAPVGTGPFSFVRYDTDQFVELKANPAYRLGKPRLDGVINRYFKSTAGAVAALKAGEIRFSYVEADDLKSFEGNSAFRAIDGDSWVVNYIGFNFATKLWDDARVRQAVMHAINRAAIVKALYGGAATLANCPFVAPNVTPNDLEQYAYDPDKARALLKAAGWDSINGTKPLTILTYYNTPLIANVLAAMQAMLSQVGIAIVPRQVDVATYNAIVYAREPDLSAYPLVFAGAQNGPDPGGINLYLNESQIPPAGANIMRVRNSALSAALDGGMTANDAAGRVEKFREFARIANRDVPWATMWVAKRYGIVSADVENFVWTPAPSGGGYDQSAERWAIRA